MDTFIIWGFYHLLWYNPCDGCMDALVSNLLGVHFNQSYYGYYLIIAILNEL